MVQMRSSSKSLSLRNFDKMHVLQRKNPEADSENFLKAVRVSNKFSIKRAVSRKTGFYTPVQAQMLLRQCSSSEPIIIDILRKSRIDEELVGYILENGNIDSVEHLCERKELSHSSISKIVAFVGGKYFVENKLLDKILVHPSFNEDHIRLIWSSWNKVARFKILALKRVPMDLLRSVEIGDSLEGSSLLANPFAPKKLKFDHTENLLATASPQFFEEVIAHGVFSRGEIAEMSMSKNLGLASLASDRLFEEASLIRVREYTKFHVGFNSAKINELVTSYLNSGLPLGWFVCSAFLLRKVFPTHSDKFFNSLIQLSQQDKAYRITDLAHCSEDELLELENAMSRIPNNALEKIILKSIHQYSCPNSAIRDISNLMKRDDIDRVFSRLNWRTIDNFVDLIHTIVFELKASELPNFLVKPEKKSYWQWAKHLDGRYVDSLHKMEVLRSAKQIRKIGLHLRNCLANDHSFSQVIAGGSVLIAIKKRNATQYVAEIRSFDRSILQMSGKYNRPAPQELKSLLLQMIDEAQKLSTNESKPSPDSDLNSN